MLRPLGLGALDQNFPALGLGQRAALADAHDLADLALEGVGLVVRVILLRPADELLVDRMLNAPLDLDDDGLVHLVADDDAFQNSLSIGPGPMCAMLMADLGADVLHIERPGGEELGLGTTTRFNLLLRNRPRLALDLKRPSDAACALELIESADVLIEGFRPGVTERLGLGPDDCLAINPRLVYGRMTGWGQDGPLAQSAGHDINYIALDRRAARRSASTEARRCRR